MKDARSLFQNSLLEEVCAIHIEFQQPLMMHLNKEKGGD